MKTSTGVTVPELKPLSIHLRRIGVLVLFLIAVYIAYAFIDRSPELVLRLGSHSEILIISAFIVIETAGELRVATRRYTLGLVIGAFLLIGLFVVSNNILISDDPTAEVSLRLRWAFSFFNSSLGICLALLALYFYSIVARDMVMRRIKAISHARMDNEGK
jgi:hypothetical protein